MAYDFVPEKVSDIFSNKKLKDVPALEMAEVYSFLREKEPKIEDPIAIDTTKSALKILPSFEKKVNISLLKSKLKIQKRKFWM